MRNCCTLLAVFALVIGCSTSSLKNKDVDGQTEVREPNSVAGMIPGMNARTETLFQWLDSAKRTSFFTGYTPLQIKMTGTWWTTAQKICRNETVIHYNLSSQSSSEDFISYTNTHRIILTSNNLVERQFIPVLTLEAARHNLAIIAKAKEFLLASVPPGSMQFSPNPVMYKQATAMLQGLVEDCL